MTERHATRLAAAVTAFFLPWAVASASAQCPPLNCSDTLSDSVALQCRLNQGGTIVLPADGCSQGYVIDSTLHLNHTGTTPSRARARTGTERCSSPPRPSTSA